MSVNVHFKPLASSYFCFYHLKDYAILTSRNFPV